MSIFNIFWQFFKMLRYLLPFLKEVTSQPGGDDCDETKRLLLHRAIRKFIWSMVKFAIFLVIIFFVIIPLHTENQVLKMQYTKLQSENQELREVDRALRDSQFNTQNNFREQGYRLTQQDEEIKRLNVKLQECRNEAYETERRYQLDKHRATVTPIQNPPPSKPKPTPNPVSNPPAKPPRKVVKTQTDKLPYENPNVGKNNQHLINKINEIK